MARDLRFQTGIDGVVPVVAGFEAEAKAVDNLGDQARQSQRELSHLSRQITETAAKSALLARQFNETGDSKFMQEFTKHRKASAGLREMQGELDRVAKAEARAAAEAKKLAAEALKLTPGGGSLVGGGGLGALVGKSPLVSAGVVGGVAAAPFAGGLVAATGLLVAGLTASIGGAIIAAVKDHNVRDVFKDLGHDVSADLGDAASGFAGPVIRSAGLLGTAWRQEIVGIRGALQAASKYVEPLVGGFATMTARFLPGFEHAVRSADPIIKAFSEKLLPDIGEGLGNFFNDIANAAPGATDAVNDLGGALKSVLNTTGDITEGLADTYHVMHQMDTLWGLQPKGGAWADAIVSVVPGLKDARDAYRAFSLAVGDDGSLKVMKKALGDARDAVDPLVRKLEDLDSTLNKTAITEDMLAGRMADKLFKVFLDADTATLNFQEAMTAVAKTLHDNGHALDIYTEKGQQDREAILGVVKANISLYDTMIQSGSSAQDAAAAYDANTAALERQLRKAGLTQSQIDGLIGKYRNVPDKIDTTVAMIGLTDAINNLDDLIRLLNGMPTKKDIEFVLHEHQIEQNRGGSSGSRAGSGGGGGGHRFLAAGGYLGPGESAFVGERAMERLTMYRGGGGYVSPMVPRRSGGGGGGLVLQYAGMPAGLEGLFLSYLQESIRTGRLLVTSRDVRAA